MNGIDFNKIAREAVSEVAEELKKENDPSKVDQAIEVIDAVNMIEGVVKNTLDELEVNAETLGEEKIREIAVNSAKAAILEGMKNL